MTQTRLCLVGAGGALLILVGSGCGDDGRPRVALDAGTDAATDDAGDGTDAGPDGGGVHGPCLSLVG